MTQTFEKWCEEWKGPPYPSLDECMLDQYHSRLNLYWGEIKTSIAVPSNFGVTELLEWLQALLLLPGRIVIYLLVAITSGVHSQLSNGVESLYGWPPVAATIAIYGVLIAAFTGLKFLSRYRTEYRAG
jgi:hypothetical protein